MTKAVDLGRKATNQNKKKKKSQNVHSYRPSLFNISPLKARVRSRDCSMFCIEKCKHLECSVSSKAAELEVDVQ